MRNRLYVFLDTTELYDDSQMKSPGWDSLRSAASKKRLDLAVSEISIAELARQAEEKAAKFNEQNIQSVRKLIAIGLEADAPRLVSSERFEAALRKRLALSGVQSIPIPAVDHGTLITRDLASRKPFSRAGKGYRDTLIWLSFLDWAAQAPPGSLVYFVSANRSDFGGTGEGDFHEELVRETPQGIEVKYSEKLADIVQLVRESARDITFDSSEAAPRVAQAEGIAIFSSLVGLPVDDLPVDEPVDEFPPIYEGRIVKVEVLDDDVESELVDYLDDTQIWSVRCGAWLRIEGAFYRDDAPHLPSGWTLSRDDPSRTSVTASAWFECTLVAEVRVTRDNDARDGAITEVLLRPTRNR